MERKSGSGSGINITDLQHGLSGSGLLFLNQDETHLTKLQTYNPNFLKMFVGTNNGAYLGYLNTQDDTPY
jgi:hypothetical protein